MSETVSREELRKRLRDKIKGKRSGDSNSVSEMSRNLKKDPQSALMSLGVDDAEMLKNAKNIVKNPHDYLKNVIANETNTSKNNEATDKKVHTKSADNEELDEEDLPPEAL